MKNPGLKCGIEIHQQLKGKKLFCSCPTTLRDDRADFTIRRKLRASAGESGKVDIAAAQEQARDKVFVYEGYDDTTCLVECDEEPPHAINQDALSTALQFAALADADISPVIQVMRKTVVDGSNTSGFQRTALVARNGKIVTPQGAVRIDTINIEEDACRIIAEDENSRTYRVDRLGIPLIEIGTAPDITSPEQCKEVAQRLGMALRSLPNVKRGLGTIRQDVNISIPGGVRIEIKGAQDLRLLPALVELEMKRQSELLKVREELERKRQRVKSKTGGVKIHDVTALFAESSSKIIRSTIKNKGKILAIRLAGFGGFLGRELQPNHRVGTELAGRAKAKAGVSGIFHSDELPGYGVTEEEVEKVANALSCEKDDAFVLVADDEEKAARALQAVHERAEEALRGVPSEVRKANVDGTTAYLRPMPGAARMYPETDVPLVVPDTTRIEVPELLEEKISRYQKDYGLSGDLATFIARSEKVHLFEELTKTHLKIKPAFIADVLTGMLLEIKRKYNADPGAITEAQFRELFAHLSQGRIHKDIVLDVLIEMSKGTFAVEKYASLGTEEIHKVLQKIVDDSPHAPFSALMGMAMKRLAGKASGKFISEELKKIVEKGHG